VIPVATTISLDRPSVNFSAIGQTNLVTATVRDQDGSAMGGVTLSWTTANAGVVSVTQRGELTAVGTGTTEVMVTAGAVRAVLPVSVTQVATSLTASADSLVLSDPGDTISLTMVVRDALGSQIATPALSWISSDPSVAAVDSAGLVTAVATGTTTVTATSAGAAAEVRIRVAPELTLRPLGELPLTAMVGTEVSLAARVEDVTGLPYARAHVSWSTGAGSGAITSQQEVQSDITGSVGAVWRLGTSSGTQRAFASIETRGAVVVVEFLATAAPGPAVSAALAADTILLSARGETAFLAPAFADVYDNLTLAGGVAWSSLDPGVATVSTDGLVTGVAPGTTWITASMGAPMDSIQVTVQLRGAITITFDDGWRSAYENAWPLLQEFGLPANVGVNPSAVDGAWPAYMSASMLDELHAAGWSMVSHTLAHDSLSTLSAAEMDYDLRETRRWLEERGYRGSNVFIAPYHDYGPSERLAVSNHYTAARGISANAFSPDSLVQWMPDNPYLLTGIEAEFVPYTTPAGRDTLRALLQRTVDEGAFLDVFFHKVPPEDAADLRLLFEIVNEFRERVLPYHELFPLWARTVH
jgi:uncharacterized protein YjdB